MMDNFLVFRQYFYTFKFYLYYNVVEDQQPFQKEALRGNRNLIFNYGLNCWASPGLNTLDSHRRSKLKIKVKNSFLIIQNLLTSNDLLHQLEYFLVSSLYRGYYFNGDVPEPKQSQQRLFLLILPWTSFVFEYSRKVLHLGRYLKLNTSNWSI